MPEKIQMANLARPKVPGKLMTRGANKRWTEFEIPDIHAQLMAPATSPRIFCIPPSDKPKPYERLTCNADCREILTTKYKFPKCLFEKTWYEGNGFANLRQHENVGPDSARITTSWMRVLVKIIKDPVPIRADDKDYYWHEMTFLVHDSNKGAPTVFCCDIDERFHTGMVKDLGINFKEGLDWRGIHAMLFRQLTCEIDHSIWACSKAVRKVEQTRPDSSTKIHSNVDFRKLHDYLRHAIHTSETLQAACQNLKDWLSSYERIAGPNVPSISPDEHHYDMLHSFQMIQSLLKRADSNEARLRNEINLAFNTVNQQDAKAVRIISVVTLLFLPATFVSTLFSMSFFNFQPDYQEGWGVSSKIWIYFAVAAPLTIVTIILWFQASRIATWLQRMGWVDDQGGS